MEQDLDGVSFKDIYHHDQTQPFGYLTYVAYDVFGKAMFVSSILCFLLGILIEKSRTYKKYCCNVCKNCASVNHRHYDTSLS